MLNSRERVITAINHQEPDRVPVDLGSTPSSGISAVAYHNLKSHLGLTDGHTRVYDVVQQLAQPEETILDRFGVDVIDIGRAFNTSDDAWYDLIAGEHWNGSGTTLRVELGPYDVMWLVPTRERLEDRRLGR